MNLTKLCLALALAGASSTAWAQAPLSETPPAVTQPPAQPQPPLPSGATTAEPPPSAPPATAPTTPATTTPPTTATTAPATTAPTVVQSTATQITAPTEPTTDAFPTPGQPAAQPTPLPPVPQPKKTAVQTTEPQPPRNVGVEPSNAASEAYATRAANAQMRGDPQTALSYAARAIAADPRDPWPFYDKGAALSRLGNVDDAVKSFAAAEQRFNLADTWGRSVAIYGAAHAYSQAGRCEEAKGEFLRYAAFIRERDPRSADMAIRYAADCRSPAVVPSTPSGTPNPGP